MVSALSGLRYLFERECNMTLYEGIILANIFISLWSTYQVGKIKMEIETIYEGLGLCMAAVSLKENQD